MVISALCAPSAEAQTSASFSVAYWNIKSGKGQLGLHGTATFADTTNCTDASRPLNAWGIGLVPQHLADAVGSDPSVIALGLGEAWTCGSPENVRVALGWKARSSERNGVGMVARHGFSGPEEWVQLDTSLNTNTADTKWVLRRDVCVDAACSQSVTVFVAHWYGSGSSMPTTYARQAQQTADFLTQASAGRTHVLVGDLNVWEGPAGVCNQNPNNTALEPLRAAGYSDAWPLVHGAAEGYTGMVNRAGCGSPVGYAWKRIDYAWSRHDLRPLSMTRFGVVPAGADAPSDHYGILASFPLTGAPEPADTTPPTVNILSPANTSVAIGTPLTIDVQATDDLAVTRVDVVEDGVVTHTLTSAPYRLTCGMLTETAGTRTLSARAYDAAGNMGTSDTVQIVVGSAAAPPPAASASGEIVLHVIDASSITGNWRFVPDATAAGGNHLWNPDAGLPKLNSAQASPADYFELSFHAEAGLAYRVWMRGRAERNSWNNDSAYLQFSGSVSSAGTPLYRIGTTSATWAGVENCSGCPLRGWGWNDNGYGGMGPLLYFDRTGTQTLRIQRREDGLAIDQIVLSPGLYLETAPGHDSDDTTILAATTGPAGIASAAEILMTADEVTTLSGAWQVLSDPTAAGGLAFGHPDAGAARLVSALAVPAHYVELRFMAEAGRAYRLWIRGRADRDHWGNDSVFVQFEGSIDSAGQPATRIGTTASHEINLEEHAHAGVSGWGWQDNGYGAGVLGPLVMFENTGLQTVRIQTREDGLRIDHVVLSSEAYLTNAPGAGKNDATILR